MAHTTLQALDATGHSADSSNVDHIRASDIGTLRRSGLAERLAFVTELAIAPAAVLMLVALSCMHCSTRPRPRIAEEVPQFRHETHWTPTALTSGNASRTLGREIGSTSLPPWFAL